MKAFAAPALPADPYERANAVQARARAELELAAKVNAAREAA